MLNEFKESPKFVEDEVDDKSANGSQSGYFSVLHKGYSKLLPIVKELYRSCVREDGEEQSDLDESNSPEELKNIGISKLLYLFRSQKSCWLLQPKPLP